MAMRPDLEPDPPEDEESLSDTEGDLQDFQGTDQSPGEGRFDLTQERDGEGD
jgi:hypothetical protein